MKQKKNPWWFACLAGAILCGLVLGWQLLIWGILMYGLILVPAGITSSPSGSSSSVGIIGGADGPTVIFVTGTPGIWEYALPLLALAGLVLCVRGCHRFSGNP